MEEPIYDFSSLKNFLNKKGYVVGSRKTYEPIKPGDVKPEDVSNGSMEFRDDGIFTFDSSGYERQVFLYMKRYHIEKYGLPRYHACKCQVIDEFIESGGFKSHYVKANTVPVPVVDLDDYKKTKQVSVLPLCSYCQKMLKKLANIDIEPPATTERFVEMLKALNNDADDEKTEVDLFGYVKDWDFISKRFREEKKYTCENCGLQITDEYDKQYVHVHHINGNKLNNNNNNLRCLCLYCHAHVDDNHLGRLTSGANRFAYEDFYAKYKDEGYWDEIENDDDDLPEAPII